MLRVKCILHCLPAVLISVMLVACGGGGGDSTGSGSSVGSSTSSNSSSSSSAASSSSSNASSSNSSASGPYTIGGTVSGLSGSVVIRINGISAFDLTITANGSFTFGTTITSGAGYNVGIVSQPSTQVCSVTSGSGTVSNANITNVAVTCTSYSFAGTVTGLTGSGLVLQLNGANDLSVAAASSSFTFPAGIALGGVAYRIQIKTQPAGQACTITQANGNVSASAAAISGVPVVCTSNVTDALAGTYSISVSGVTRRAFATFYSDGTYIIATHADDSTCSANYGNGVEYGVYRWTQSTNAFAFVTAAVDTNGDCGIANGSLLHTGTLIKNSNGTLSADLIDPVDSSHSIVTLTPVSSATGTLIGSWSGAQAFNQGFIVYASNGTFFNVQTQAITQNAATFAGIEDGCYTLSGSTTTGSFTVNLASTCAVNGTQTAVDTTGTAAGFSSLSANGLSLSFSVTGDSLQTWVGSGTPGTSTRITAN